ncbi:MULTISPECIES: ECF transporter S component [Clostridium]|nr:MULTISPECIES: ECF transporter S component [Clostridium]KEI15867.1 membrane protein [Clostridium haemolyticum NCTC 9693]KGN00850.1 membrane protein [Clostridium haemolyticum NCTC 8350]CAG7838904.1 Pantothenic acid transporter PanT [Clostridium haemolyticum]
MEKNLSMEKKEKTRKIAVFAMFSAISVILGFTPLGIIPVPPVAATIIHVPVIIIAILEGPIFGALMGIVFGVISLTTAIMRPSIISFISYNPIVSVFPRVFIGLVAYYTYKALKIKRESVRIAVAAALGTITNTIGFLGMGYLIYGDKIAYAIGKTQETVGKWVLGIGITHCIPEVLVAVLITIPIVFAGKKIRR